MTNMVDGSGTTKFTYTPAGQLLTEGGTFGSDTLTNAYSNRLRVGLTLQQPSGAWTNSFAYDTTKRLTNVTSPAGTFGYLYDPTIFTHRPARIILGNTSYITNIYDANARLTQTYLKKSDNTFLDSYAYTYNPANQRTNLTRMDGSTVAYRYDRIGQLTVADSSVSGEDTGYSYDHAWNINSVTNASGTNAFLVNGLNELTNWTLGIAAYDTNGNMISRTTGGTSQYIYDDENRLVRIIANGDTNETTFTYDGFGRLRTRTESVAFFGGFLDTTTGYIYDGFRVIQERSLAGLGSGGSPTHSYTRGNDLSGTFEGAGGIGGVLARSYGYYFGGNPSVHNYYFADGNGNITYMLDNSQSMVASYRYDPFGNTISKSGALADDNVYRFSSKEFLSNSGLYYFGYRFYDPSTERWINRDPIQEYSGVNLYTFVYNNPLTWVDLLGLTEYSRVQVEVGINPTRNPIITQQLNLGCVGLCMIYQQSGCTPSMTTPEKVPGTTCFLTEPEARAYKCPPNKKPFVFGKFGQWERGNPPVKGPDGRVPSDSISSAGGHFNYVTVLDTGRWRYAWMDHRIEDGPQTVYCENEPFQANTTYPREIWCVTCKCP